MFDSTTENPELIWNDEIRKTIKNAVQKALSELLSQQLKDPTSIWNQVYT